MQPGPVADSTFAMSATDAPCPETFNLAAHVLAKAACLGEKTALQIVGADEAEYSYLWLEAAVRGCGTLLLGQGLQQGDRVLMRLGNTPAFPVLFLAAIAVGLVPIPTSAALTTAEITLLSRAVLPALIVTEPGIALPETACPILQADQVLAAATLPPCDYAMGDPERLGYIIFTSGTSGRALPVAHAHRAILARHMMHGDWEGLGQDDRLLHAGAFNWTYTLGTGLLDPWLQGATALIPGRNLPATALPQTLADARATIFAAAPGVYRHLLRQPMPNLPALRHGLSAGEAMPEALAKAWQASTGTLVHQALGLSECSTFISGSPARPAPPGAIGFPQPGRRVAVLDEAGAAVAQGQPGTLAVHCSDPGLMLGYYQMPLETAHRRAGEWFLTGDQVAADASGALTYLGRRDDMMNPDGFRVFPAEIETAMQTATGIHDCAAVEVEIAPGTRIIACLYTAADVIPPATLASHANLYLARYKQPRVFIRLDALPRNPNNKLNRVALRDIARHHIRPQEPA